MLTNGGAIPIAGYKVSLSTPTWGALTDDVVVTGAASLRREMLIDPLLEGELAFLVERELSPDSTLDDIVDGCRVAPAIEIADSRWEGWHPSVPGRFVVPSGAEIEADNAVSGWLVLADSWVAARDRSLSDLRISMRHERSNPGAGCAARRDGSSGRSGQVADRATGSRREAARGRPGGVIRMPVHRSGHRPARGRHLGGCDRGDRCSPGDVHMSVQSAGRQPR